MAKCSPLSVCGRIGAYVDCITNIIQGADSEIIFQLVDSDGAALDLSIYSSIVGMVYGELGSQSFDYSYPIQSGYDEIIVLQSGSTNTGKLLIRIESDKSADLLEGRLFVEFKLSEIDSSYNDSIKDIVIGCLYFATVKTSITRFL